MFGLYCITILALKIAVCWAGEMAQQLRTPTALPEDPVPVPSTHIIVLPIATVSGGSDTLFLICTGTRHGRGAYSCRQNTHTCKIKLNSFF